MKSLKDMGNEYTEIYNKTINAFPIENHDIYYTQSRNEFYRKGKEIPTLDLKEEKKEYKRVKHIIKSSVPLKQAFNEVRNFRNTYTNSKCRNKIFFQILYGTEFYELTSREILQNDFSSSGSNTSDIIYSRKIQSPPYI